MDELLLNALDLAGVKGAKYADIRLVNTSQERLVVRNGVVDNLSRDQSTGFGVRVLVNGSWGFASSYDVTTAEVERVTDLAVQIAKASNVQSQDPVNLGSPVTSRGTYITPIQIDPFQVSSEQKLDLLLDADRAMTSVKGIRSRQSSLVFIKEEKTFANTEGAYVEQTIFEAGGGIQATAVGNGEVQRRSYPQSMGRQQGCAGWEYIVAMDLPHHAERIATEAAALLPEDHFDFVIFFAALEHMTFEEREIAMRNTWSMLRPGGLWVVIETPNRLHFFDDHSARLPFFHWLPDEVAWEYGIRSPRKVFSNLLESEPRGAETPVLLQRFGRGISYHDFELALGPLCELEIVSSLGRYTMALRWLRRLQRFTTLKGRHQALLSRVAPQLHPAFLEPWLNFIIRKP